MKRLLVLLLCLVLGLAGTSVSTASAATISTSIKTALTSCLQQEYLMRDTYQIILSKYPMLTTLGTVLKDEIAMIATLKKLFANYRITVPADAEASAAQTTANTATSASNADRVAINLERATATLMTRLLQTTDNRDVAAVAALIKTISLGSHTTALVAEQVTVATPPNTPTTPTATAGAIYGSGITADTIANTHVGGPIYNITGTQVSFKFTASSTDTLVSFLEWWKTQSPGYGGGTGGTIRMTLQTDNGSGLPSGTILATQIIVHPAQGILQYSFASPPSLTAGTVYHLVHTNIDLDPSVNFVSVNSLYCYGGTLTPLNARFPDGELGQCIQHGTEPWTVQDNYTPILQLTYSNGSTQGVGYNETGIDEYATINGATHMARESFTVAGGDRMVGAASVRLRRSSGTGALVIRLETSGGALIESANVSATSIPISEPGKDNGGAVWVTAVFLTPHALVDGSSYNLRVSTDASTTYTLFSLRKAPGYGFTDKTYFGDGSSLKTTDGSTWTPLGRITDNPLQCNLEFFFDTM